MLFVAIYFVPLLFSFVSAMPLKRSQQKLPQQTSAKSGNDAIILTTLTIPSTKEVPYILSNRLTSYYENIVDQVMETTVDDVISSAPHSYELLYPGHDCQASTCPFINVLHSHLNLMRSNLVASVRPLLDSNLQSVLFKMAASSSDDLIHTFHLTELLIVLNQRLSIHLGLVVSSDDTADIIVHQSVSEHWTYHSHHRQLPPKSFSRRFHETANNYDDNAKKALTEWLRLWLSDIENILYTQFDESIDYIGRTVMESFLY